MISRRSMLVLPVAAMARESRPAPSRVRTLDPADPVARGLAELYDALLATHGPEHSAYRACEDYADRLWERGSPLKSGEQDETSDRLYHEHGLRESGRRTAYFALLHAVAEADGGEIEGEVDGGESRWMRYGVPLHSVRVGDRLYLVSTDVDSSYDPGVGCYGFCAVSVIDL